jgi:mono/diheme cytochrome c family protein
LFAPEPKSGGKAKKVHLKTIAVYELLDLTVWPGQNIGLPSYHVDYEVVFVSHIPDAPLSFVMISIKHELLLVGIVTAASAAVVSNVLADEQVDYLRQIKPVLAKRCYACHGSLKHEGGLRLDTAGLAIRGGDDGPVIIPGDAAASVLIQRVTATDESERMPPIGEPLHPGQIAALRTWIAQKATAPADEQPEADPRDHWAFRPIIRPAVPKVASVQWVRNPIDAFIAQQHEQCGLTPQVEAPPDVLMRRLSLDLIGLPSSEEDLALLKAKGASGWYEPVVERLLNDPRYGERWARHWMDVWRYSDWWGLGAELRNSQHHIWHWRDWIIESLNANTPYDEMVRLMLAADELHPEDLNKLRATGFLARNYFLFNRNQWMDEVIEHVSKGFLGLTMNCAKCHDHKFDPISQIDYYRMRAFFEPYHVRLDVIPGEPDLSRDGVPRVFDGLPDAPTYVFTRGQESMPDKSNVIAPGVPDFLVGGKFAIHPVLLPKTASQPERQRWVLESYMSAAQKQVASAEAAVAVARERIAVAKKEVTSAQVAAANAEIKVAELAADAARSELVDVTLRAAAMRAAWAKEDSTSTDAAFADAECSTAGEAVKAERRTEVAKARHAVAELELKLSRAPADQKPELKKQLGTARDTLTKAEQLAAAKITAADHYTRLVGAKWTPTRFLSSTKDDPQVEFQAQSTGRRSALAAWITNPRNPLTARVAVNHIWMRHMGTPLVASVFDFGRKGSQPTHPELLDWLAAEFIASGWDMKHLHRLIVTSSAYRMSSSNSHSDANIAKDQDNLHLWRRSPVRLEAEAVRDSVLWLAGTLDPTRGGPPVPLASQADSTRRSLYFFHSNNECNLFLATFDEAGVKECYRRDQSVVPQQALALTDSRLVHDAAGQIEKRLSQPATSGMPAPDDAEFVKEAFYRLLGIRASGDEVRASTEALAAWRALPGAGGDAKADTARVYLIWALLNHNDFITVR